MVPSSKRSSYLWGAITPSGYLTLPSIVKVPDDEVAPGTAEANVRYGRELYAKHTETMRRNER
jgi:hypothetical protein